MSEVWLREEVIIDRKLIVINEVQRLFQGTLAALVWKATGDVEANRS
jgi:hypothetical protein